MKTDLMTLQRCPNPLRDINGSGDGRQARFDSLRRAYPDMDEESIWTRIHDEEVEAAEAAEGRRIAQADEDRAERYAEGNW